MILELENGKYKVRTTQGCAMVIRHGEAWRDITGDKFVLSLINKIEELQKQLDKDRQK